MEKIHRDREHRHRRRADAAGEISRRAAGSRGNGRQPRRQRLQMGGRRRCSSKCWWSRRLSPAPGRSCGSLSMTTAADCRPPNAPRFRGAASGSTSPSRDRGWGCRSWSISRPLRRQPYARRCADRRPAGGTGAAGRVRARRLAGQCYRRRSPARIARSCEDGREILSTVAAPEAS